MATITKTIGSTSTIDTETPSSCSGSNPYTVTFSNDPSGVVVGDKVYITDESTYYDTFVYSVTAISGSSYTLSYSSGGYGAESPCGLYNSFYEQAPAVFKREHDYTSPRAWAADLDDSSIYSNGDDAVGEIQINEKYDEGIGIANGSTVTLNSVKLTVASSVRHNGTAGTGAGFKYTGQSSSGGGGSLAQVVDIKDADNVTLEWLEFDGTGAAGSCAIHSFITDHGNFRDNNTVRNCLMHGFELETGGASVNMIRMTTSTSSLTSGKSNYILNNIIYGNVLSTVAGGSPTGIYANAGRDVNPIYVYNNTVHDLTAASSSNIAIGIKASRHAVVTNNIVSDVTGSSTSVCFAVTSGSFTSSSDYNLATDSTAPGSNSVNSATLANIYESASGTVNLHLKSGSPAIDAGTDLGTTPSGVNIDIDGRDRDAEGDTWDIGADEYVVNGIEVAPAAATINVEAQSPSTVLGSIAITPASSATEVEASLSGATAGSLAITPASAVINVAGVDPTVDIPDVTVVPGKIEVEVNATLSGVVLGSLSISPPAASIAVAAQNPTVSLGSTTASPAAAAINVDATLSGASLGSLSITPPAAQINLAGTNDGAVLGSLTVTPQTSAAEVVGVSPTVGISSVAITPPAAQIEISGSGSASLDSLTITPQASALAVAAVSPTVVRGSVAITPSAASVITSVRYGGVIQGSTIAIIPEPVKISSTAQDPTLAFGSTTASPDAASIIFQASGSASLDSLTVSPSAAVVATAGVSPTILAGVTVAPDSAVITVAIPPIDVVMGIPSAALGYWISGRLDYETGGNADYRITGRPDYEIGDEL